MKISTPAMLPIKEIMIKLGNVQVLGNGVWGKALAGVISNSGHETPFKTFVFAAPTNVMRNILNEIKTEIDSETLFINCSKGIELGTHKLSHEIAEEVLGKNINYFSLIGPSFAEEVVAKNPTIVNLGYDNPKYLDEVVAIFKTPYFEVVPTPCLQAIEIMSAFKNIYAIGCGIAEGLGYGVNTRTKLIISAHQESMCLINALKIKYDQSAEVAFIGDLILTCSSTESRNFTLGKNLVADVGGNSVTKDEKSAKIGQTTEGVFSVASVKYFEEKSGIKLPLASFIYDAVNEKSPDKIKEKFNAFIQK